jgi:hypothetical protein
MGLFDDIADVYTGAKQAKDVAPSSQLVIRNNQSVRQAIESNKEQRERNEDRGYTPPTQDQQVAQQIAQQQQQQQQKEADSTGVTTLTDSDGEKIIDKFGRFMAFGKPVRNLTDLELNQILEQVRLYQKGLPNYFEGFPGGLNIAKGFADSITQGETREDGTPTLQGLKKFIREEIDPDSNILESFKVEDPATYLDVFGLPATDAGLDFFANLSLDDDTVDKLTQQKIIEARQRLQDAQSRQDANMGIMAASPALPGLIRNLPPDTPVIGGPADPPNPVLTPVPVGGITPTTTTGITPFNINQFYASLPQYTQQGIMAPVNLSRFTDALRMFPGATV